MTWLILIIAGVFEVGWAIGLKYSDGFSKLWPSVLTLISMAISVGLLGYCTKHLPVGTAYAVWTGVGAVGTVILGVVLFNEPTSWARGLCILLIISGMVGLKLTAQEDPPAEERAVTGEPGDV